MFCSKCGNKLSDDSVFCNKCGAKNQHDEAVASSDEITNKETDSKVFVNDIKPEHTEPINKAYNNLNFKSYIDNHVRETTGFYSAEELLNSKISLKKEWRITIIPTIIVAVIALINEMNSIAFFILILFISAVSCSIAYFLSWRKMNSAQTKYSSNFDIDIDTNELIDFLNNKLNYLSPYFGEWGMLKAQGYTVRSAIMSSVENSVSKSMHETRICTGFHNKSKLLAVIIVKPAVIDTASGKNQYFFSSEETFSMGLPNFGKHICLYKSAPILQAAMEYFLEAKRTDNSQMLSEKTFANTSKAYSSNTRKQIQPTHAVIALFILTIITILFTGGELSKENTIIKDVKSITFEAFGSIPIGEAVNQHLQKSEWIVAEANDENKEYTVVLNAFSEEVGRFSLEFEVTYYDDMVYAEFIEVVKGDEVYTDEMSLYTIMYVIYGQTIEEAENSYWDNYWSSIW